mgnify:CR=1 FL=1|tara:strand:+ start:1243 stop:2886 length:1644 start_codon:yes stop_codon:yes gene_type:complete
MNNYGYKYGPATIVPNIKTRKSSSELVVTGVPVTLDSINFIVNNTLTTGLSSVDLDLDNISGKTTRVESLLVDTISANTGLKVTILSDLKVNTNVLIGGEADAIDSNCKLKIIGNFCVSGESADLQVNKLLIKDNIIGLGVLNSNADNFINGLYFPKNDLFSGFGLSISNIGILNLPFGSFESSTQFNQLSSTLKRFNNNKTSMRFVYIDTSYDLENAKTSLNPFNANEQTFINNLNNLTNQACNNYINIESDNITCHGGHFISGLSKDLHLIVTNASNQEFIYQTCSLSGNSINMFKNLELKLSDHAIYNNGNIDFYSKSLGTIQLKLSDSGLFAKRNVNFDQDGASNNSNIIFGADGSQRSFSINNNSTSNPYININADTTLSNNKIELKTRLDIDGPKIIDYPTYSYQNSITGNKIGSVNPMVKNFIQSKTVTQSATTAFSFKEILETGYTDVIFSGFVILTDNTNDEHLHIKIEGSYNTNGSGNLFQTETIVSIKGINLTNSSSSSDFTIQAVAVSSSTFVINVTSTKTASFKGLIKLEIIQV